VQTDARTGISPQQANNHGFDNLNGVGHHVTQATLTSSRNAVQAMQRIQACRKRNVTHRRPVTVCEAGVPAVVGVIDVL
jgi:hypothetical protein